MWECIVCGSEERSCGVCGAEDEELEDLIEEVEELRNENGLLMEAFWETGRSLHFCSVCQVHPGNSIKNYVEHIRGWNHRDKKSIAGKKTFESKQNQTTRSAMINYEILLEQLDESKKERESLLEIVKSKDMKLENIDKILNNSIQKLLSETQISIPHETDDIEEIISGVIDSFVETEMKLKASESESQALKRHRDKWKSTISRITESHNKLKQDLMNKLIEEKQHTKIIHDLHERIRQMNETCCKQAKKEKELKQQIAKMKKSNKKSIESSLTQQKIQREIIGDLRDQIDVEKKHRQNALDRLEESMKETNQLKRSVKTTEKRAVALSRINQKHRNVMEKMSQDLRDLEKYRFAAIALKHVARNLPSARINQVEWTKSTSGSPNTPITLRTIALNQHREDILSQPKYRNLKFGQYLIQNNPSNQDCQYKQKRLDQIKRFVEHNHIGNSDPSIKIDQNGYTEPLTEVAGKRTVEHCEHLELLKGDSEVYAKMDIPGGVILGQYVGNEMLKDEYYSVYNGTKEEFLHSTYLHGDSLQLSSGEEIGIYIDGIAAGTSSPLLYINDGRVDIREDETAADRERMNTEFVMVLCKGWPLVLVMTTKKIKEGESLWINYGPRFGLVLDEQDLIDDQRQKAIRSVNQILTGIDLNEKRPIHIFDEEKSEEMHPRQHDSRRYGKENRSSLNTSTNRLNKGTTRAAPLSRIPKRKRLVHALDARNNNGSNNTASPPKRRRLNG